MNKKLLFFRLFVLVAAMMCALGMQAQEAYANYTPSDSTLTFYYDNMRSSRTGTTYDLNTGSHQPGWYIDITHPKVTRVVFNSTFANARPTTTYYWFCGMSKLRSITGLNYLNTTNVTDMSSMFNDCGSLTSLDLSSFNTAKVTTMSEMFYYCESLTSLNLSSFNTANVTTMKSMFYHCSSLTSLDLSSFNTAKVTNMKNMFMYCTKLTSLNLGSFNTANVTDMENMFNLCMSLTSLNLSSFNTFNVTNMSSMFYNCTKLTSLNLGLLNTANVTDMSFMFYNCSSLTSLNLGSFKTASVTDMHNMFGYAKNLEAIYVGEEWSTANVTSSYDMFDYCISLVGGLGTTYKNSNPKDKTYAHIDGGISNPGYMTEFKEAYAALSDDCQTLTFYYDGRRGMHTNYTYSLNEPDQPVDWSTYHNTINTVVFDPSFADVRPITMRFWFDSMSNLTGIIGLEYLNTSEVTDMYYLFNGCSSLTNVDLEHFDTSNVTCMSFMFRNCSSLGQIDMTGFDTRKVTDMRSMFNGCTSLERLDLRSFDTHNVTNIIWMFRNCSNLATIYAGTSWDVQNVTNSAQMFTGCTSLVGGRGTTYDASHVDKTYAHIDGGTSDPGYLTAVDYGLSVGGVAVTSENASNITGPGIVSGTASYNHSTRTLTLNNVNITLNTAAGISVNDTFDGDVCYINLVGDNHLDVTNYYPLIVRKATTITGNGTLDMGSGSIKVSLSAPLVIEGGCTVMGSSIMGSSSDGETLAVRGSETSVIMSYTIWGFASLTLNDGLFIVEPAGGYYDPSSRWMKKANGTDCTSGVIINNGRQMYAERYAENNGSVTLKFYYDTQRNTRPGITFSIYEGMVDPEWYEDGYSYDITKVVFDPSFASARPTSTQNWFAEMQNLTSIEGIQYLNTSEVTTMSGMFWECTELTAVDVSGFDTRKVTDMSWLFSECYELNGLDVSGWNTPNVTTMQGLFGNCSSLTSIDVSHFNTSNVTNMSQLFDGCSGLTSLDVSNFNTSNVTDMSYMFNWCNGLQQLDLSGFNTSKVTNMSCMFNESSNLRTIYVGDGWITSAVTSSSYMFDVCTSLVGGKGTTYNANHVDAAYAHIDGGPSNPGYFSEKGGAFTRGDVNGNNEVTIADVSALIDYLLTGDPTGVNLAAANCNGIDGVSIADVSALIDYLLTGSW